MSYLFFYAVYLRKEAEREKRGGGVFYIYSLPNGKVDSNMHSDAYFCSIFVRIRNNILTDVPDNTLLIVDTYLMVDNLVFIIVIKYHVFSSFVI